MTQNVSFAVGNDVQQECAAKHHICGVWKLSGSILDSQSRGPDFESTHCYRFKIWAFSFSPRGISSLSCINEYLAIDSSGNVIE